MAGKEGDAGIGGGEGGGEGGRLHAMAQVLTSLLLREARALALGPPGEDAAATEKRARAIKLLADAGRSLAALDAAAGRKGRPRGRGPAAADPDAAQDADDDTSAALDPIDAEPPDPAALAEEREDLVARLDAVLGPDEWERPGPGAGGARPADDAAGLALRGSRRADSS